MLPPGYSLQKGKGVALTKGDTAIVFSYGPVMLSELCKASKLLKENHNFGLRVINMPWLNYIDQEWLCSEIGSIKSIFTLDNHLINGGQGERIGAVIAQTGFNGITFRMFGLEEIPVCGRNNEVLEYYGLDALSLVSKILQ